MGKNKTGQIFKSYEVFTSKQNKSNFQILQSFYVKTKHVKFRLRPGRNWNPRSGLLKRGFNIMYRSFKGHRRLSSRKWHFTAFFKANVAIIRLTWNQTPGFSQFRFGRFA